MRFLLICFLLLLPTISCSQKKSIINKVTSELENENSIWYEGTVKLREDNSSLKGLIQFNEKLRILKFSSGETIEVLIPNDVVQFEFNDLEQERWREFISVDYPIREDFKKMDDFNFISLNEIKNVQSVNTFFELLGEAKIFVVLMKVNPTNVVQKRVHPLAVGLNPYNPSRRAARASAHDYGQETSIYFLDNEGNMFLYSRGTWVETKKSVVRAKNNYFFGYQYVKNKDIELGNKFLKRIMGDRFPAVQEFINSNKLDSNEVEDLLKIIEFYKTLED